MFLSGNFLLTARRFNKIDMCQLPKGNIPLSFLKYECSPRNIAENHWQYAA